MSVVDLTAAVSAIAGAVSAIATSILVASLLFYKKQVAAQHKQTSSQHEWNRREFAIKLMRMYVENSSPSSFWAVTFLTHLDEAQVQSLAATKEFELSKREAIEAGRLIMDLERLSFDQKKWGEDSVTVTKVEVVFLRRIVARLLNRLEIVAVAYANSVADKKMVYQQFRRVLFLNGGDRFIGQSFVEAVDYYPCLIEMAKSFRQIERDRQSGLTNPVPTDGI